MLLERAGAFDKAVHLYARYEDLSRRSEERQLRTMLAGRYAFAVREQTRQVLTAQQAASDALIEGRADSLIPPNTVAVFPLEFRAGDARYAPLGRGLSAMLMIDLARVARLTVLERMRLDVLLDEIELAPSGVVEPGTAPRVGRLLRARHVIGGGYRVADDGHVYLDLALRDVVDDAFDALPADAALSRFFALEKDLVFRLIGEMGIDLSDAERRQIEYVPTRDMQAFLAYSRGLEAEDDGRFGEAIQHFQQAVQLDPGFGEAINRADLNEGLQEVGGGGIRIRSPREEKLRTRHQALGDNIGSLVVPGPDGREPLPIGDEEGVIGVPPDPPP
jgi:TolB-like protein